MGKTNFDRYLEEQLADPAFRERFQRAGREWDIALQIAAHRNRLGLSQKDLAERVGTTQQQISRMESSGYRGHSLRMLRRVADALGMEVVVGLRPRAARKPGTARIKATTKYAATTRKAGRTRPATSQRPANSSKR